MRGIPAVTVMLVAACAPGPSERIGGETLWLEVPEGKLKTQVFTSATISSRPVLVLILHGDIPNPRPDYQYLFAKAVTQGLSDAPERSDALRDALGDDWHEKQIVAAGVLRPGYTDPSGDRSSGAIGMAVGDNYTPEVVDAVATATRRLKATYDASAVVLVGHSGGGAIAANVLGRHPGVADAALLVACGCDPEAWRSRMRVERPSSVWNQPNPSLMPLSLVASVPQGTRVRLLVGDEDNVTLPQDSRKYADALRARGIDARVTVVPKLGHNILMTPESFRELGALVKDLADASGETFEAAPLR